MKRDRSIGKKQHKTYEVLKEIVESVSEEPKTKTAIARELMLQPEKVNCCLDVLVDERILFNNELTKKYNITSLGRYFVNDQTVSQTS